MRSTARGRGFVFAAAVLWSLSGAITKTLALDPLTIAFYRGLFAGLALLPFVPRSNWVFRPIMIPMSLIFGAMTGLFLASQKLTTAANTIYLQYTATFWVVPLAYVFLHERPERRALVGMALAMVGIGLIVIYGHSGSADEWKGMAFGISSGLAYACIITGLRGLRGLDPLWLSAVNNLGGALALFLWMTLTTGAPIRPSAIQTAGLIAFGVIQMAIPYALFARGLREVDVAEAALITLIEPILNPVWALLVASERPSGATLAGGAFLLVGVAINYVRFLRKGPRIGAP